MRQGTSKEITELIFFSAGHLLLGTQTTLLDEETWVTFIQTKHSEDRKSDHKTEVGKGRGKKGRRKVDMNEDKKRIE